MPTKPKPPVQQRRVLRAHAALRYWAAKRDLSGVLTDRLIAEAANVAVNAACPPPRDREKTRREPKGGEQ